ncbi:ATPase [Flagellimonas aquimarina]|uniref:ATPase n=1 Tax=Flagellimonas aquimarina TaxID=2201895 RepID=A0A316KY45_9FLAO|nr:restriction endonuclease [Allomuricauda koreensis]PWL37659.1 ATPase [Allomuricauda koreensis]
MEKELVIVKSSGEKMIFSTKKLERSLLKSGASKEIVDYIVEQVSNEVYEGISTKEIYNRAYAMLRQKKPVLASRYKLKKAIYELGPTGFPFEKFVAAIMQFSGYQKQTNTIVEGKCVDHEIDVIAFKNNHQILIECKFHGEPGRKCDVKVPLYINSRFNDIKKRKKTDDTVDEGWVLTNTRFTKDALKYGNCIGLYLLSWDYPKGDSLKERIDRLGLYPITVSTIMSKREKQFLLSRDVVLCRQLMNDSFYLDHLGVSEERKQKILNQIDELCNISQ